MSIKSSSLLKLSVASAVLLSVGACKASDKGQGALKSQSVSALNLSKSQANIFSKYFEMEPCQIDELESLGALAGLGLGENGTNGMTYDSRAVEAGSVTYKNFALKEANESFNAKSVVFHCPQMNDDAQPNFKRMDMTGIVINNEKDGVEFSAETVNIADPTPGGARAITENLVQIESALAPEVGFGAISITGAKIKSAEVNGTLKTLTWGEIRDEEGKGKADLTLEELNFAAPARNGTEGMTLDFKGLSIRNLNMGSQAEADALRGLPSEQIIGSVLSNLNAFEKPYDEFIVEPLKFNSKELSVNMAGMEGQTTEKGGVITTRQSTKPIEINLKPAMGDLPQFQQQYEMIKSLGLETINLSGSSVSTLNSGEDTVALSNGLLVVDDVFRLNFEYKAEGLGAMIENLNSEAESANPLAGYDALKLRNFRMTLEDNSIVDKGLTVATQMTGQSEAQIKLMLTGAVFLAGSLAQNELQADVYSKATGAFADFVKNGGTLTIEANPPEPFSLAPLLTDKAGEIDPASLGFSASQAGGSK